MASLKVAMIAPPWLPVPPVGYGGIENVLYALVPELIKLGVEVELFTIKGSTVRATKKHWLYAKDQYDYIHRPMYDSLPINVAHFMFALDVIRRDGNFDIIHDHNGFIGPMVLANSASDLPPAIHTIHGPPFSTPDRLEQGLPDNVPMWKQFKGAKKLWFVPISDALGNAAPAEIKSIMLPAVYNSVAVEQFPFVQRKKDYFITLARFHPEKGQAEAVQACLELGYKLKMAGGVAGIASPRKLLLELANPLSSYRGIVDFRYFSDKIFPHLDQHIEHIGDVAGEHKMQVISQAKALLFPIQWDEPFGMAAIEAMACGTPVIAMARGAMPEIIEHGVNGFLANDLTEFKKYMQQIDTIDPKVCRESVESRFSAPTIAKSYLARYQSVLKYQKATLTEPEYSKLRA